MNVYECFGTVRRGLDEDESFESSRVRESYADGRRTSRARALTTIVLLSVRLRLCESFESDDECFENESDDLERSSEIFTLRGAEIYCFVVTKYRAFIEL